MPETELIWFISLGTLVFTFVAFFYVVQVIQGQRRAWRDKREKMEAIQEREEKYRDLFDNVNDIVYIHSLEGTILDINLSGAAMVGKPIPEIIGKHVSAIIGDAFNSRINKYLDLLSSEGRAEGTVCVVPGGLLGCYIEYNSSVIRKEGKPIAVRGIARNVSERRKSAHALRQSEKRFKDLVRYSPLAMLILTGRNISYANNAAVSLLKAKDAAELLGASIDRFMLYDVLDPDQALMKMLSAGQTPHIVTERLRLIDGEIREIESASLPVVFEGHEALHLVIRDITATKQLESSLRELPHQIFKAQEAERRRVAGDLHDGVNQMLGIIQFRLQGSEMVFGETVAGLREDLMGIRNDIERASDEVKRIYQGLRPSLLDDFGLPAAVRSMVNSLAVHKIPIECSFENLPTRLDGDVEIGLYRIIQEALNNVVRHSGATAASVRIAFSGSAIRAEVSDNGKGMSGAMQLGDPSGSPRGIGLDTMRERAARLGGVCSPEPGEKGGTVVVASIPYSLRD